MQSINSYNIPQRLILKLIRVKKIIYWFLYDKLTVFLPLNNYKNTVYTEEIYITLTTMPSRFKYLHRCIESLFRQKSHISGVLLWIAEDIPESSLPSRVLRLKDFGLEIHQCRDIRSFKKLVPALEKKWSATYITADDDLIYPSTWAKDLVEAYRKDPKIIHAHRAHRISFNKDGQLLNYGKWERDIPETKVPSHLVFPTTGAGVIFPPNTLHSDVIKDELFMNLCPTNDDVWFKIMAFKNNTKCSVINSKKLEENLTIIEESDWCQDALGRINQFGATNVQLNNVLEFYNIKMDDFVQTETN